MGKGVISSPSANEPSFTRASLHASAKRSRAMAEWSTAVPWVAWLSPLMLLRDASAPAAERGNPNSSEQQRCTRGMLVCSSSPRM
eukprot:CAMPEP_0202388558 /NCGR_PEP_ID=MMETSP1127-20130417/78230_1 /ASSEMBLY_ACC=CAM_ASM_000462 /TAXON_ID=3047 /ORGANISM="Dunaliella tertiolecta, Strain CCMP1320" /LENGTH=84 /DNA_ID=CAMNT_0048990017 /DNA_START=48 /DNA_END=302 /DNA_ORIENTATION=+